VRATRVGECMDLLTSWRMATIRVAAACRAEWPCLLLLMAIGTGCVLARAAVAASEPAAVVVMTNELKFQPPMVSIRAGETVAWRNTSLLVHSVTADPAQAVKPQDVALPAGAQPFNSGLLPPQATFRHTFDVAGTYRYFCIPHEAAGMLGTVMVKPAP
jgi:plastocyanin